ncbi:mevalonate kinase [Candidatus Liberibacter africanus]|uniref:GHMP kinase n=1 Tax=Candidatus Liberibacter africanus PTSAPSY TaxID=1277257 RepID=A0A0G3I5D9_LIBAF|nr:mevalonate kinase [Candidatus Liberibacter africanus]AKK19673.1 GHMP kinase [Candidatus Liberibacter africanus PTSAPSY]QTP63563.1 mevalonate kinase [Candidatus Liberibacter africanus]
MGQKLYKIQVSAPGSLVLIGEHGVLYEHAALAFAIDKRIKLSLTLRKDRLIKINSSLGQYCVSLDLPMMNHPLFSFILVAIEHIKPPCGFDLNIISDLDSGLGLGSSAAITVAITAALLMLQSHKEPSSKEILAQAHAIVLKTQGKSSGIDLATSIYGGLIFYSMPQYSVEKIDFIFPIHCVYSGYKTSTAQVLKKIVLIEKECPEIKKINQSIYTLMGELSHIAAHALRNKNLKALAQIMNKQQGLLETLGVSDPKISEIVWKLREQPNIIASKISGSGLGDCVIALGEGNIHSLPYNSIDCHMHSKGIHIVPITSSYST